MIIQIHEENVGEFSYIHSKDVLEIVYIDGEGVAEILQRNGYWRLVTDIEAMMIELGWELTP